MVGAGRDKLVPLSPFLGLIGENIPCYGSGELPIMITRADGRSMFDIKRSYFGASRWALMLSLALILSLVGIAGRSVPSSAATSTIAAASPTSTLPTATGSTRGRSPVVTFGTQTASSTKPDGRGIYEFESDPGGSIEDHVAVINYSLQVVSLIIKATDAVNTPQGGFAALPINERSSGLGAWIALPSNDLVVTLNPRSSVIIPFRVAVPINADPGDHIGVLTATLESSVVSKAGQRTHLLQTVGTRVFLRVAGPLHPRLAIEKLRIRYADNLNPIGAGRANLTYTVTNIGNVAVGGRQKIFVTGLFGSKRTAINAPEVQLLLPGFSVKESVTLARVLPEVLDTGHVSISLLYVPGSIQPQSGPFSASSRFWAIPWTLLGIIVLVALVLLLLLVRRRRRRRRAGVSKGSGGPDPSDAAKEKKELADQGGTKVGAQ